MGYVRIMRATPESKTGKVLLSGFVLRVSGSERGEREREREGKSEGEGEEVFFDY